MGLLSLSSAMQFGTGAVNATKDSVNIGLKDVADKENMRLAQEAQSLRDATLQQFQAGQQTERLQHTEKMAGSEQTFRRELQGGQFAHDIEMKDARQAFESEQHGLNRDLTREQIASNEKIAEANRKNALAAASIGGTVTTDTSTGNVVMVGKDGKVKPLTLADGKPLKGAVDLTASQKAYTAVLSDRLKALDKEKMSPMVAGNPEAEGKVDRQIAALNYELLKTFTAGVPAAPAAAPGKNGYDPATKTVWKNGANIGTAASEAEARKLWAGGSTPAAKPATGGLLNTPAGDARAAFYRPELEAKNPMLAHLRLRANHGDESAWRDYLEQTRQPTAAAPISLR